MTKKNDLSPAAVTILVDAAVWPWRAQRWAHLISDTSTDELHTFTAKLGIRRLAFGGDHYDINGPERAAALGAGARAVDAREIVVALRAGGLRCAPPHGAWRWVRLGELRFGGPGHLGRPAEFAGLDGLRAIVDAGVGDRDLAEAHWSAAALACARYRAGSAVDVTVLDRRDEQAIVVSGSSPLSALPPSVVSDPRLTLRTTHRARTTTHELIAHRSHSVAH